VIASAFPEIDFGLVEHDIGIHQEFLKTHNVLKARRNNRPGFSGGPSGRNQWPYCFPKVETLGCYPADLQFAFIDSTVSS